MEHEDVLIKIPVEEWPMLRDVFKKDWPRGLYTYYAIENFIQWHKKNLIVNISMYCPKGGYEDGTVIIIFKMGLLNCIHVFALDKQYARLKECLLKTSIIAWEEGPFFYSVDSEHWTHVKEVLQELNLESEFEIESQCYWITRENALKFDTKCPEDVYIGALDVKQSDMINNLWFHKYPGSEEYISTLISYNGGLGVYKKNDNTLVSWIMKNHLLGLGVLQTLDGHQRRGYAELVVKAMTKNMSEGEIDVHACFIKANEKSKTLFKKINFQFLSDVHFLKIKSE